MEIERPKIAVVQMISLSGGPGGDTQLESHRRPNVSKLSLSIQTLTGQTDRLAAGALGRKAQTQDHQNSQEGQQLKDRSRLVPAIFCFWAKRLKSDRIPLPKT